MNASTKAALKNFEAAVVANSLAESLAYVLVGSQRGGPSYQHLAEAAQRGLIKARAALEAAIDDEWSDGYSAAFEDQ